MEQGRKSGACLCGAVKFEASLKTQEAVVCHCRMCRKWGGGPSISVECETDIGIDGAENLRWYQSSAWGERGFCRQCGSSLFFRLREGHGDYMNIATAALDDESGIKLGKHIFIDAKPPYYDFADDRPRLTEAEFLKSKSDLT